MTHLPTPARLWAGCVLCVLPLGLMWAISVPGSQAPVRVFLVFAALVLAYAAAHRRTDFTRRLVRTATLAMAVAGALAVADRAVPACLCLVSGLALVAPLVWPRPAAVVAARTAR